MRSGHGAAATLLLRTHAHLLLLGTGEVYGSAGRRFARTLLPQLRAAGYGRIDLWLPGSLTRDVQAALRLAAAELPVREARVAAGAGAAAGNGASCTRRTGSWDGVDFQHARQRRRTRAAC